MAIETEVTVAAVEASAPLAPQARQAAAAASSAASSTLSAAAAAWAEAMPEEGVSLNLSARGKLLSALDAASAAISTQEATAAEAKPLPITRATLYAIEARLLAARQGAAAIAAADAQRPASSDPQRQQQAVQATDYLYGRAANPFAAMGRAQLAAIVYDESGAYTVNERYAAAAQRDELDRRFWAPVLERAQSSGDWRPVIEAGLVFYASLSPLEQTAYPSNYILLLQQYLALPEVPIDSPLPTQKQVDLVNLLASLVLPSGPWAQASAMMRNLLLARSVPSAEALQAAMPKLLDILPANMVRLSQDQAYLVLLQRVFGVGQRADEPAPMQRASLVQHARDLLSFADRRYLADAYAQAGVDGIAAEQVDALASDLAAYRRLRAGGMPGRDGGSAATSSNAGQRQDQRMSAADAVVARRLLTSLAARDTRLDHGFLAWLLDPRGGGWNDGELSGHQVAFSALERLLAALAGLASSQQGLEESSLEPDYRQVLYRIALQEMAHAGLSQQAGAGRQVDDAVLAAQMAAMAREEYSEHAFMDRALALLRMYRSSLRMSDAEQRTLSELVYASLRRRRMRARRGKLFVAWSEPSASMPSLNL